jgi:peptidoglycan/LPS O-acetylase OafA/YrhL
LFESYTNLWGVFGLTLFFLLSGYLLTWTEGMRASRGNYRLRSYAFRRALRLIPAYYAALAVCLLLWPGDRTLTETLLHLTVLQGFAPDSASTRIAFDPAYWYLTSEVVFYALLPLLVLKIRGLYPRLALFGVLLAVGLAIEIYILANAGVLGKTYSRYLFEFPLTHLWLFMAGVLLRTLIERLEVKRPEGSRPTVAFLLFASPLVLLALFPYASFFPYISSIGTMVASNLLVSNMVANWLAISFLAGALLGSPVLSRVLSWRLLGFVGVISYSFYLLHTTFLMLAGGLVLRSRLVKPVLKYLHGPELWIAFAGYLGVMLVVIGAIAYLSYRYIESPFLRYKPK